MKVNSMNNKPLLVRDGKLESQRLILRQWQTSDLPYFAKLNNDPKVMEYFPAQLKDAQSNQLAERLADLIDQKGWGFWALELVQTGEFIGFVGLNAIDKNSTIPNAPFVEIGWRISSEHWGNGYAPEAAKLALSYAFETLMLDCVYSFTSLLNKPSQRVMQKLMMKNTGQDFEHPKLTEGHRLKQHCLYKIDANDWRIKNTLN